MRAAELRARLWKLLDIYIRSVQKVLIFIFLLLTYFLAMGLTYALALVFNRSLLWDRPAEADGTFWTDAEGYEPDLEDCQRQS